MAATGCLLNCLREVRLERFHRNFTERGLTNCEQLSSLLVDDYGRFGVVSTDDRRRLFQLIHIIKSVQADGIYCQHGTATRAVSQPSIIQQQTKPGVPTANPVHRKEELPDVTKNGVIPVQKIAAAGDARADKCPAAPSRQFIKPISTDCNYRVQYEQPQEKMRLHITQETKVVGKSLAAPTDSGSGTPKFNCRKTLNFSDSDLYSDGNDSYCCRPQAVNSASVKPSLQPQSNNSVMSSSAAAKPSCLRPPQVVTATCTLSPRAFIIPAENRPVTRHRSSGSCASQTEAQTSRDVQRDSRRATGNSHAAKKLSFRNDDSRQHVYFPTAKIPSPEEPETHIEQIYYSSGYNYGVPGSTLRSVDKVFFRHLHQSFITNLILRYCVSFSVSALLPAIRSLERRARARYLFYCMFLKCFFVWSMISQQAAGRFTPKFACGHSLGRDMTPPLLGVGGPRRAEKGANEIFVTMGVNGEFLHFGGF